MLATPSIERLCNICTILESLAELGIEKTNSSQLSKMSGISAASIRKDINNFGDTGINSKGYEVLKLLEFLKKNLGLDEAKKTCVVGLGRMGTSMLNYPNFINKGFDIVAGFESSTNKIETMDTDLKLYPSYDIADVVKNNGIEVAILTVPAEAAQICAQRLYDGGIKAILNFAPVKLDLPSTVIVKELYVADELRTLSAMLKLNK